MYRKIIIATILLLLFTTSNSQNPEFKINNYTPADYGKLHEATNSCIIQDIRGVIYSGNANGILEYDAFNWRFIPVKTGAWVTSLATDSSGIIYVGSQNEFGYLAPNVEGLITYISLSDSLEITSMDFSNIWKIHVLKNSVVFQAEEKIFIFQNNELHEFYPETSFHLSFSINNTIYIRQRDIGLMRFFPDSSDFELSQFRLIDNGETFKDFGVFAMVPLSVRNSRFLIATQEKGLWIFDEENSVEKLQLLDNNPFFNESVIYGGVLLHDKNIALNTLYKGLIIIDTIGNIKNSVEKNHGIASNKVLQTIQDKHDNIWLALDQGISKIDYSSPLSYFPEKNGISGNINDIKRYKKLLFVGTSNGLFVQNNKEQKSGKEFTRFKNFSKHVNDLVAINNNLIVGTNEGLFRITLGSVYKISDIQSFALRYSKEDDLLFVGGPQGLNLFKVDESWKFVMNIGEIHEDVKFIAENHNTIFDSTEIWLGTGYQGAIRVLIDKDLNYKIDKYYVEDGLHEDWVVPFQMNDSVLFGTSNGLLKFIDEETMKSILPDSLKNDEKFYKGYFEDTKLFDISTNNPFYLLEANKNRIWISLTNQVSFIDIHEKKHISKPFLENDYS